LWKTRVSSREAPDQLQGRWRGLVLVVVSENSDARKIKPFAKHADNGDCSNPARSKVAQKCLPYVRAYI
jgi:hypothetical protein